MKKSTDVHENKAVTRRDAIKSAGAALAGLAALGMPGTADAQGAQRRNDTPAGDKPLAGQVAIVTGAGRGIGRASAIALAAAGANVVVLDIGRDLPGHNIPLSRPSDMAETVRLIEATGSRAQSVQADVRDMNALRTAAERTVREFGRIDILHANAGIAGMGTLAEATDEQWRLGAEVNLLGAANSMRAVLPQMTQQKSGRIIATVSTFGRQGAGTNVPYAAMKWGLVGLIKSAALDVGKNNITVNGVAPTGVVTGFGGPRTVQQRAEADKFFSEQYHALPVGALQPEDIGGTVVFLASPAARYITGAVIDVAAGANARYTA